LRLVSETPPPRPKRPWWRAWTIGRASGVGAVAGLAALLLWPIYAAWQDPVRPFYLGALALAALCGASILAITAIDLARRGQRGGRLLAFRLFDVVLAIALLVPAAIVLRSEWGL